MTDYPEPREPLTAPPAASLTFAHRFRIKAATGIGITEAAVRGDLDQVTAALAWWAAQARPEYAGITWDNVQQWTPRAVRFSDDQDLDAAELEQQAAERAAGDPGADGAPFTDPPVHVSG